MEYVSSRFFFVVNCLLSGQNGPLRKLVPLRFDSFQWQTAAEMLELDLNRFNFSKCFLTGNFRSPYFQ